MLEAPPRPVNTENLDFVGLLILSGMFALAFILIAWPRRNATGARMLILFMGFALIWSWAYAVYWMYPDWPDPFFWQNIGYIGVVGLPTTFFIYSLQINDLGSWINRRTRLVFLIEPLMTLLLLWTDPFHNLFFAGQRFKNVSMINSGGPWFWINTAYSYGMILASFILIFRGIFRTNGIFRKQLILVMVGSTILPAANLYTLFVRPILPGLDITPLLFTFQGIFLLIGLFAFSIFDLAPVAKTTLIETMPEGLIVIDLFKRVVDINHSALTLLNLQRADVAGRPVECVYTFWPNLREALNNRGVAPGHTQVVFGYHTMDVNWTPIRDRNGRRTGELVTWREITQTLKAEVELELANKKLKEQLNQIQSLQTVLKEQAVRDPLTGLFNRRYLDNHLAREIARADRKNYPVCMIMVDMDGFKQRNDTYGHDFGDALLVEFCQVLNEHIRRDDVLIRLGGDEFLILMSEINLHEGSERAEQLRRTIEATPFKVQGQKEHLTASFGVAVYPSSSLDPLEVIRLADQALYQAKNLGKNQVCACPLNEINV